jgi:hypothetical protein
LVATLGNLEADDAPLDLLAGIYREFRTSVGIPCVTCRGEQRICRARWLGVGRAAARRSDARPSVSQ